MSTSDQDGNARLTRKQLREIRLTGSTPVITDDQAAEAAAQQAATPAPQPIAPAPEPPTPAPPTPAADDPAPMTRREARRQERIRTGSLPVQETSDAASQPAPTPSREPAAEPALVSGLPSFSPQQPVAPAARPQFESAPAFGGAPAAPPAADRMSTQEQSLKEIFEARVAAAGLAVPQADAPAPSQAEAPSQSETPVATPAPAVRPTAAPVATPLEMQSAAPVATPSPLETPRPTPTPVEEERPKVGAAFGIGVKGTEKPAHPARFDDLVGGDSSGSHRAPSTLIFTPSPGAGSLSGPIASTGELLVTGTYSLPEGLGSRGHAIGTTDGKEADAVLIDGELAPASSPTPIAASSAVATSKPAGEVIRPPAPDKGSKLMITLAIVAGGLALALAAALIIAFTTRVFG